MGNFCLLNVLAPDCCCGSVLDSDISVCVSLLVCLLWLFVKGLDRVGRLLLDLKSFSGTPPRMFASLASRW